MQLIAPLQGKWSVFMLCGAAVRAWLEVKGSVPGSVLFWCWCRV